MDTCKKIEALFPLGMIVMTPGAASLLEDAGISTRQILARHQFGDWGDLCEEDEQANRDSIRFGERILSSYKLEGGSRLWVITEADRSVTTLLLPSEY
jgi:hypothetical protein